MAVYKKSPQTPGSDPHRIHGSIALMLRQWTLAEGSDQVADFSKITAQAIDKACANTRTKYPHWPAFLYSTDLSQFAAQQPSEQQWWIGDRTSDDVDMEDEAEDSAYAISVIFVLSE